MKNLIPTILLSGFASIAFGQQTITLVEQFTGFKCEHCPEAMLLMDSLETEFQDSVVFVNIHSGIFATPNVNGFTFLNDLRISEGDEYYQFCDPIGIPNAMISRKVDNNIPTNVAHFKNFWREKISEVVALPKPMNIDLSYSYDAGANVFNISTQNEVLLNLSGDYNIVYYIIEDNVITEQFDSGGQLNSVYAQQHVLRDVLNGAWGELLFSDVTPVGTIVTHNIQYYPSSNIIDLNECSLIAYVRNSLSNEIIQVSKVEIDGLIIEKADNENNYSLVIYPNPTGDNLQLNHEYLSEPILVQVIDQIGRVVHQQNFISNDQLTLDISSLVNGTYSLRILNTKGNQMQASRFVKN